MLTTTLQDARTLASFHSDAEARTTDFFEAYANELPDDMAARFRAYGDKFIRRHARVQLKSLFKLLRGQCNKVITDVNTELQYEDGDGEEDGIRESIEEAAGFAFEKPTAPESAALVTTKKRKLSELEGADDSAARGQSLSQIVPRTEQLDAALPDYVFDVITTPDPLHNPISEPELSALTDEALKFLCKKFGRHNIGAPMARIYAAQIRNKVKIGARGKGKNRVAGEDRNLANTLVEKARNRTYKTVSCLEIKPLPCRHAPSPCRRGMTCKRTVRRETTNTRSRCIRTSSRTTSRLCLNPRQDRLLVSS